MNIIKKVEKRLFSFRLVHVLIGQFRKLYIREKYNKTVLIISLQKLGDSVLTIPAIKAIKEQYSDHTIVIYCFKSTHTIYKRIFSNTVEYIYVDAIKSWLGKRIPSRKLVNKIRIHHPELVFDLLGNPFSFFLTLFSGAKMTVGMNESHLSSAYDKFVVMRNTPHLMDMYLDVPKLVNDQNLNASNYEYPPNYNKENPIFINTLAGWKAKEWNFDKFLELAKELSRDYRIKFIHQKDSVITRQIEENGFVNIETESIAELIEKLQTSSLLIGNDSGPIHIASLLGIPTYSIYGPTNPLFSKPFGNHHKVIFKQISCTPTELQYCHLDAGRNCESVDCLKQLSVSSVLNDTKEFIKELGINKKI